ncbi:hypothetical protein Q4Q34_03255 [Flavivirga abyssicola]|uniref:sodium:solute symporter family transporter n=1 Tax=Flavivirga abyssicola TaxID=3063533 RepID=UPI0026E08854|nr:hypothetical protein [Flavivirga sp. MEBiC07777]WVK14050.1 hypothetical protein Q4Q34_03255 [Flavivirga sp. MEBiC07777]
MGQLVIFVIILFPLFYFTYQSYRHRKKTNNLIRFFQYGEKFKVNRFFATMTASNSGMSGALFLIAIYGYFYGLGIVIWVISFWIATQVTYRYVARKLTVNEGREFWQNNTTLHEYLGSKYDEPKVRMFTGILSLISYCGLVAAEIILGYEIINSLMVGDEALLGTRLILPSFSIIVLIILLILSYASMSGFWSVVKTDIVQLGFILIMMVLIWVFISSNFSNILESYQSYYSTNIFEAIFNPDGSGVFNFLFFVVLMNIVFWGLWWPSAMDQWHRSAATRDFKNIANKKMGATGSLTISYFIFLSLTFVMVGVVLKTTIISSGGEIAPLGYLMDGMSNHWSGWLRILILGFVAAGFMAAVISTIDSYIVVAVQSLISDFYITKREGLTLSEIDKDQSKSQFYLMWSRIAILIIGLLIIIIAILFSYLKDVFTAIYFSFSFMFIAVPFVFLSFNKKKMGSNNRGKAMLWSLTLGLLWCIITNIFIIVNIERLNRLNDLDNMLTWYNYLYANPFVTSVISIVSYFLTHKFISLNNRA